MHHDGPEELRLRLPLHAVASFAGLFSELESRPDVTSCWRSYALSMTTLEDVFIRTAGDDDGGLAARPAVADADADDASELSDATTAALSDARQAIAHGAPLGRESVLADDGKSWTVVHRHALALWTRRLRNVRRRPMTWAQHILNPVVPIFIGCLLAEVCLNPVPAPYADGL